MQPGAVNTEMVIALPGGASVAAIVTQESAQALGLKEGMAATAAFKACSATMDVLA